MWSLIRPCGVDFIFEINRRVDMLIRAIRVYLAGYLSLAKGAAGSQISNKNKGKKVSISDSNENLVKLRMFS